MSRIHKVLVVLVVSAAVLAPLTGVTRGWAMPLDPPRECAAAAPIGAEDDGGADPFQGVLAASAAAIRPAGAAEVARFVPLALGSVELARARARLAPLVVEVEHPRLVGTTVGRVGVYFPIRGARDGPASQYALWFAANDGAVVAEADFVGRQDGVHVRMVVAGEVVMDELLAAGAPPGGGFWECFRWCIGASLSQDAYAILRAVCGRVCNPPGQWCGMCMLALGILEAGMISGCTHACTHPA